MNNEEKILEILAQVQTDLSGLKQGQAEMNGRMDKLDGRIDKLDGRMDKLDSRLSSVETDVREIKHITRVTYENTQRIWSHLVEHQTKLWEIEDAMSKV